jgi:cytochrome c peroxidase
MHNGMFENLDQVIEFFDQGGGKGNTVLKPLNLTADEKKALRTFLTEALSGEDMPFQYPKVP